MNSTVIRVCSINLSRFQWQCLYADGDLGDFLTPDTEEEEEEGAAKKLCRAGRKRPRSARERLNWSESSSSDGEAAGKTGSSSKQQQQGEDSTAGADRSSHVAVGLMMQATARFCMASINKVCMLC